MLVMPCPYDLLHIHGVDEIEVVLGQEDRRRFDKGVNDGNGKMRYPQIGLTWIQFNQFNQFKGNSSTN